MRQFFLFITLLLLGIFSAHTQEITFTRATPDIGMKRTTDNFFEMDMTLEVEAQGEPMSFGVGNSSHKVKTETINKVQGKAPSEITAVYDTVDDMNKSPMGAGGVKPKPVIGKHYLIMRMPDTTTFASTDGSELTKDELDFLSNDYQGGGFENKMPEVLDGKTFKIGDTIPLDKTVAQSLFNRQRSGEIKDFSVTLTGTREDKGVQCAVFILKMAMDVDQGPLLMDFSMDGEALVEINTLLPHSMRMVGVVNAIGAHEGSNINGSGTLKGTITSTYQK